MRNERVNEDLQLKVVRGTPRYEFRAQGPVHVAPIRRDRDGASEVLGYLWFSDDESAAADSFGALPSGPAGHLAITELSTVPALDALRVIAGFTQ